MVKIEELLPRRSDLSTFLVHLTRDKDGQTAKDALMQILRSGQIQARSPLGHAVSILQREDKSLDSQRVVCFTETPLEYTYLLLKEIEGRKCQFGPYGVAIPKRLGRNAGANPVWYVDISPTGIEWLSNSINALVEDAVKSNGFEKSPIARLAPFVEQMGSGQAANTGTAYRKEFWWEREWRFLGNFTLPEHILILCPESEFVEIKEAEAKDTNRFSSAQLIDPRWGLERIIAHLAGFNRDEVELV